MSAAQLALDFGADVDDGDLDLAHAEVVAQKEDALREAMERARPCRCSSPWGEVGHCLRCGRDRSETTP